MYHIFALTNGIIALYPIARSYYRGIQHLNFNPRITVQMMALWGQPILITLFNYTLSLKGMPLCDFHTLPKSIPAPQSTQCNDPLPEKCYIDSFVVYAQIIWLIGIAIEWDYISWLESIFFSSMLWNSVSHCSGYVPAGYVHMHIYVYIYVCVCVCIRPCIPI